MKGQLMSNAAKPNNTARIPASPHPISGICSAKIALNPKLAKAAKRKAPTIPSQVFFGLI